MLTRLRRTIRRIGQDVATGRHIESYIVGGIAVALVAIDVLGSVPVDTQLGVIIAALAVLVLRGTAPPSSAPTSLNDVLRTRDKFTPYREFIRGAKTLEIYSPSAINILRDAAPLREEVLDKGGRISILLQDPAEHAEVERLQQQLDIGAVDLHADIHSSVMILKRLKQRKDGTAYDLSIGFLPYSPGFSLTIVDAERTSGRLVVEFFGYYNEFIGSRMHIHIVRQDSEYWFEYWVNQFREMQKAARTLPDT